MTTLDQFRGNIWIDVESIEELLQYELFKELHNLYQKMDSCPLMFPMDELRIMNEVGLAVEWLKFHRAIFRLDYFDQLVREVYADTGLKDHAEAVFSLVYAIVCIVNWPTIEINKPTLIELKKMNMESWCGGYVNKFIQRINKEGKLLEFPFHMSEIYVKLINKIGKEMENSITTGLNKVLQNYSITPKIAEESDEHGEREERERIFSLDEIVNYAKENLTLDSSVTIQAMLYSLLVEDGTKEERAKVASIPNAILNRMATPKVIGQVICQQSNIGDVSGLEALLQGDNFQKLLGKL